MVSLSEDMSQFFSFMVLRNGISGGGFYYFNCLGKVGGDFLDRMSEFYQEMVSLD